MEWKKGFLTEPPVRKLPRRKKSALPDEAYLPEDSYDFTDDDRARFLLTSSALASNDPTLLVHSGCG